MRTVLLTGKGILVEYLFSILSKSYPSAVWVEPKKKWYYVETRHELTIAQLNPEQVVDLGTKIADLGVSVKVTLC